MLLLALAQATPIDAADKCRLVALTQPDEDSLVIRHVSEEECWKVVAIDTFTQELRDVDRAVLDSQTEGLVKVHVRRGSDRIVGATIVAAHAGEMISEVTLAMTAGVGLKTLARTIHPYPTQSEALKRIADAYNRTRLTPSVKSLFAKWLAWQRR